jgi:hypothetical protein
LNWRLRLFVDLAGFSLRLLLPSFLLLEVRNLGL